MKNWTHKVSLEWLKERQRYITASDIAGLTDKTDSGRKRSQAIIEQNFIKIFADKSRALTEEDCISTGAAARGHIMEPIALRLFQHKFGIEANHWDDFILIKGNIGWSPDGLDRKQPDSGVKESGLYIGPSRGFEVKCYYTEKHLVTGMANKLELPERWQIATAFYVCPTLRRMDLILYNPSLNKFQMMLHSYFPEELEDELQQIEEIDDKANDMWEKIESAAYLTEVGISSPLTEEGIYADYERKQRGNIINPD